MDLAPEYLLFIINILEIMTLLLKHILLIILDHYQHTRIAMKNKELYFIERLRESLLEKVKKISVLK